MGPKFSTMVWDWKEQPDWKEVERLLRENGFKGSLKPILSTGSDMNAIVITPEPIEDEMAEEFFDAFVDRFDG